MMIQNGEKMKRKGSNLAGKYEEDTVVKVSFYWLSPQGQMTSMLLLEQSPMAGLQSHDTKNKS